MTENEQIQEMARIISIACKGIRCSDCETYGNDTSACVDVKSAEAIYNAGYRKVERGTWLIGGGFSPLCSECGEKNNERRNFCPNCGADMRGGQNDD